MDVQGWAVRGVVSGWLEVKAGAAGRWGEGLAVCHASDRSEVRPGTAGGRSGSGGSAGNRPGEVRVEAAGRWAGNGGPSGKRP